MEQVHLNNFMKVLNLQKQLCQTRSSTKHDKTRVFLDHWFGTYKWGRHDNFIDSFAEIQREGTMRCSVPRCLVPSKIFSIRADGSTEPFHHRTRSCVSGKVSQLTLPHEIKARYTRCGGQVMTMI